MKKAFSAETGRRHTSCEEEWFPKLFSVLRKLSYFDVTFSLRRSLQNRCTIYETMNSVFGLLLRYKSSSIKEQRKNEKKSIIFGRKTKALYMMMATLLVQQLALIVAVLGEGEWFLYLLSVLRNMR